jgi:hypothetical protein
MEIGNHRTRKAAVTETSTSYVKNFEQEKIIFLFGTVDYDSEYDYKKQRDRV